MKERVIRYDGKEYRRKFPNKSDTTFSCLCCDLYKGCNNNEYKFGTLCLSFLDADKSVSPDYWWSQTEAK